MSGTIEVRGYWCHDKVTSPDCKHAWVGCFDDWTIRRDAAPAHTVRHWQCARCGGRRWWHDAHTRGEP